MNFYNKKDIPEHLLEYFEPCEFGLEETPEEYVIKLVEIFREIKRVLKKEGTVWLNLGDSYYGGGWKGSKTDLSETKQGINKGTECGKDLNPDGKHDFLKPKDLVGIPWRLAFTLQEDGWWLRQDIIWKKGNSMPESVKDRCTKSHEYIFLLTKSKNYYYDQEAIMEEIRDSSFKRLMQDIENQEGSDRVPFKTNGGMKAVVSRKKFDKYMGGGGTSFNGKSGYFKKDGTPICGLYKNKRSVWDVNIKGYKEAHFATFPEELIEPCIKAGCPKYICSKCGLPLKKEIKKEVIPEECKTYLEGEPGDKKQCGSQFGWVTNSKYKEWNKKRKKEEIIISCGCKEEFKSGIVLDPFMGSGTTGLVALKQKKNFIGIELNPEYIKIAEKRLDPELNKTKIFRKK